MTGTENRKQAYKANSFSNVIILALETSNCGTTPAFDLKLLSQRRRKERRFTFPMDRVEINTSSYMIISNGARLHCCLQILSDAADLAINSK